MFKRLWYNSRARSVMMQVLIACLFFGTLAWLVWNAHYNLTQRGIATGFGYLSDAARFPISESLLAYRPTDSYARAFAVGLMNTLYISAACGVVGSGVPLIMLPYGMTTTIGTAFF